MDLVLAVVGLGILCAAVTLSFQGRWRQATVATRPVDDYWLTVREAEILTRSGAPFV